MRPEPQRRPAAAANARCGACAQLYPEEQITRARLEVLRPSNMVDYAIDEHRKLHGSEPPAGAWLPHPAAAVRVLA